MQPRRYLLAVVRECVFQVTKRGYEVVKERREE